MAFGTSTWCCTPITASVLKDACIDKSDCRIASCFLFLCESKVETITVQAVDSVTQVGGEVIDFTLATGVSANLFESKGDSIALSSGKTVNDDGKIEIEETLTGTITISQTNRNILESKLNEWVMIFMITNNGSVEQGYFKLTDVQENREAEKNGACEITFTFTNDCRQTVRTVDFGAMGFTTAAEFMQSIATV